MPKIYFFGKKKNLIQPVPPWVKYKVNDTNYTRDVKINAGVYLEFYIC